MKQQVFVKIDEYNEINKVMDMIKDKVRDAKSALENIKELKNDEDSELELWAANLQDIEDKVLNIDTIFSGSGQDEE